MARQGRERIPGFQEDIHPGVWNRHQLWGAPRKWAMAWIAVCGYALAYIIFALPAKLLVGVFVMWIVGQRGLMLLTRWDPHWDDVLLARFRYRRYKSRYEAG